MSQSAFPNGEILTSSALVPDAVAMLFQSLFAQVLGIDPIANPQIAFSAVRVSWQQVGQPAWGINDDVCALSCVQKTDNYSAIRDQFPANPGAGTVDLTITYVRVWNVHCELYGPNSFDRARLIRDAMFLGWTRRTLAASNFAYIPRGASPVYVPQLFQGQWWKRTDLDLDFNELVTATVSVNTIASAEVILSDGDGLSADFTATA